MPSHPHIHVRIDPKANPMTPKTPRMITTAQDTSNTWADARTKAPATGTSTEIRNLADNFLCTEYIVSKAGAGFVYTMPCIEKKGIP